MTKHGGELGRASVKVKAIEGAGWGGTVSNSGPPLTPSGPFRSNMMREKKPECTLEIVLKKTIPERACPRCWPQRVLHTR